MSLVRFSFLAFASAVLAPFAAAQTTWYVDVANSGPGIGSLTDPYSSIQFAIEAPTTIDGDTLSVALGGYEEALNFLGKAITIEGQSPASGVGYPVLFSLDSLPPPHGTAVVFNSGEGPGSVLRHMDVVGGLGDFVGGERLGGGILISGASPRLEDVIIRKGTANRGGGVAIIAGSAPVVFYNAKR